MEQLYYNISNSKKGVPEVRIYGEIWEYGEGSSLNLSNKIRELVKDNTEIVLKVNSGGGSVSEAVAIYNILKNSDLKVTAIVEGIAASAMSFILMACDTVVMGKATRLMTHKVSGRVWGSAQNLRDAADNMDSWEGDLYGMYAQKTGLTEDQVKSTFFIEGKDVWISPKDAIRYGLADEIIDGVAKEAPSNVMNSVSSAWGYYDSVISNHYKSKDKSKLNMKKIAQKLGLPEDASESDILKALDNKKEKTEHDKVIAENASLRKERAESLVNEAVKAGKVLANSKEAWVKMAEEDYSSTKSAIDGLPERASVASVPSGGSSANEDRSKWMVEDYLKNDPDALNKMSEENPSEYQKLIEKSY